MENENCASFPSESSSKKVDRVFELICLTLNFHSICPLRCVSATPAELIRFTWVNVSIPTRSAALRICSIPAPAVRSPPRRTSISGRCHTTHNAAIQLNSARSRQEVKHRNNKQHPVTFQNKTLRVDTSTQISKKRQTQALLLILQSGTLRVVVFNNTDQWPWSQVIMWLSQELLSLVTPAVYHTMRGGLKSQPVEIAGQRSKTGSEPQRSRPVSSGNWGLCISFDVTNAHAYIALHQLRQWQHIQIQKHVKTHTYGKLEPKNVWHFNFNSNNELLLFLFVWFG